jgi:streptogramin lyase
MFGLDPQNGVWSVVDEGELSRLDTRTGEIKKYQLPAVDGIYDHEVDSKGRSIINVWDEAKFRLFDPKTEKFTDYPTPTPQSGPRRGDMDSKDRQWVGLYWAGLLGMFDANTGEVKEYDIVPDSKPFGPPFPAPYSAAVDEKNQFVWTSDFNSSRIYRFDMKTERMTEYFMPLPYEVRDLTVDKTAARPTVWIPAYRPPSKMVKIHM